VSYLGIIVATVFASNALLVHGLGICPGYRITAGKSPDTVLALAFVNAFAASFLWCIRILVLAPFGLESLDLLFFAIVAVPLIKTISWLVSSRTKGFLFGFAVVAGDSVVSCLVFGIALLGSRSEYSLLEGLAAGACSGFGYWMSMGLLDTIRERLELSNVPASFRGAPAMLLSAGLMAMAFMGIDSILIKNITV
jgi:electron transport complex protein RnfA